MAEKGDTLGYMVVYPSGGGWEIYDDSIYRTKGEDLDDSIAGAKDSGYEGVEVVALLVVGR